ncbi:MAG: hypothetical protein E7Y34_01925 [Mycoplasma sp.]|nr:hypothetical protein [Mycoplasma sp.]
MEVELDDLNEDWEVVTVADVMKNRNKSVGKIEKEQHNSEVEKRKNCWSLKKYSRNSALC